MEHSALTHLMTFEPSSPNDHLVHVPAKTPAELEARTVVRPRTLTQIHGLRSQVEELLPEPTVIDPDTVVRSEVWGADAFMREGPDTVPNWPILVEKLRQQPDDETLPERMERISHLGDLLRLDPAQLKEAIELQQEALELARALGDRQARGSVELRLAVALQYNGQHPAALRHFARADTIIRVTRLRMVRDRVEFQRGTCLAELGNIDGARAAFEEALSMLTRRKTPDPMKVARAEAALANLEGWTPPPRG